MQIKDSHLGFESFTAIASASYCQKEFHDSNYLIKVVFDTILTSRYNKSCHLSIFFKYAN